jgi:SPP1 gp7 family putative phage head morphogenesis protein
MTLYYGPVRKHLRVIKSINQPSRSSALLAALRGYLNENEPTLITWLKQVWQDQQNAISYSDISNAILSGNVSLEWLQQWQEDYANLIATKLAPKWREAMQNAAKNHVTENSFEIDLSSKPIEKWIQEYGAKEAVNLSTAQHDALKAVIQQAANGAYGPDELARVIRPLIGMTTRNIKACERYYETLRSNDGMKADAAKKKAMEYAVNAHRARALSIARTELANAYNQGADQSVRQAQEQGYMSKHIEKTWLTAEDERECEICAGLDGVTVDQDATFPGGYDLPTAHPQCRCSVEYKEVDEPSDTS